MKSRFRWLMLLGFLACVGAMGFALFLQYFKGEMPCPLCIFQRIAMIATGLVFLVGLVHGPRGWGRWVYAVLASITALVGAGLAARHVWLQALPPGQVPGCGPSLSYLLDMMPFTQVVQLVLKGDGSCAVINAAIFGVSLPIWTLVAFVGLAVYTLTGTAFMG
ncbi:MAG: disulfide bond formation protein B, partial [Sinobacteraceae bacterium]|nr:disulfide bond formation protein B [Nevskiaceae bacterium]